MDDIVNDLLDRRLLETIWRRRTHRVSQGVSLLKAGSMTYESTQKPHPLTELEEAVLIAMIGHTGLTMPDRPFQDPNTDTFIMAKPNLTMMGRSAGSPDNSQGTYFIMINDSGTYFLRPLPPPDGALPFSADALIEHARRAKVQLLDRRIDVGTRNFPAYLRFEPVPVESARYDLVLPDRRSFAPVYQWADVSADAAARLAPDSG